jgi:hypothetical protein
VLRRSFFLALTALSAAPLLLAGCPDDGPTESQPDAADVQTLPESTCPTGFLGDPNKEPVIELRALRTDGTDIPLANGDDLAIIFPPQGGRVAFVGVRATNIDGCGVQLTAALRDTATKQIRLDGRTLNLRREADGWGASGQGTSANLEDSQAIGDYANVPLCPNQWASVDVFDNAFELEVKLQDQRKKSVTAKITVTPRCAEPGQKETACRCLCKRGYVLGESCGEDAGVEAGTD